jgi:hypothetical protein
MTFLTTGSVLWGFVKPMWVQMSFNKKSNAHLTTRVMTSIHNWGTKVPKDRLLRTKLVVGTLCYKSSSFPSLATT